MTEEALKIIKKKAVGSLYFFAKEILGYSYLNEYHEELCNKLQDPACRRAKILWPRGTYKTTIGLAECLWWVIQEDSKHPFFLGPEERILIFSGNDIQAKKRLKVLKTHMERNRWLPGLWPNIFWDDPIAQAPKWTEEALTIRRQGIYTEETFEVGSTERPIAGRHYTKAMIDDIVHEQNYQTEVGLQSAIDAYQDLRPVLAVGEGGQAIYGERVYGTVYDDQDAYAWIDENIPESDMARFTRGIWTDETETETILGDRMTVEMLNELKRSMTISKFTHQYLNERVTSELAMFKAKDLEDAIYDTEPTEPMYVTVCMDPGRKIGSKNDKTAITVRGVTQDGHRWCLLEWQGRLLLRERCEKLYDICEEMHAKRRISVIGIEDTDAVNVFAFKQVCLERGKHWTVEEIKPRGRTKGKRLEKEQPYVEQKRFHLHRSMKDSMIQFIRFKPDSNRRDDLADSWSMHEDLNEGRPATSKPEPPFLSPDAIAARAAKAKRGLRAEGDVGWYLPGATKLPAIQTSWFV